MVHEFLSPLSVEDAEARMNTDPPGPTIPRPTSFHDLPARDGPTAVMGTSQDKFLLYWDYDHGPTRLFIPGPPAPQAIPGTNGWTNAFYGPPVPDYTLTHRQYWHMVDPQLIGAGSTPPGGYTRSETLTEGMSTTQTTTLSAEFGVEFEGLSAKLSATFEN